MSEVTLSFMIENHGTANDLAIEAWVDNDKFFDSVVDKKEIPVTYSFKENEDVTYHTLKFVLKNKNETHTKIDAEGNILEDSIISIKNICIDELNIDQVFYEQSIYKHDTNGHTDLQEHNFYGDMGCNGTVELEFYAPVYMWLLENM